MTKDCIDLHLHTTASDGTFTPEEVIDYAVKAGLKAIALTDHDSVGGLPAAYEYIKNQEKDFSLELIPGIEFSCIHKQKELHMLGYFIDYNSTEMLERTEQLRQYRIERGRKMAKKLANIGIIVDFQEILKNAGLGSVGRIHFAKALIEGKHAFSIDHAMQKYLLKGKAAFVPHKRQTPQECIQFIKKLGGIAILAHPGLYNHDEFIPEFAKIGLDGLEALHSSHSNTQTTRYMDIAKRYDLLITGGSDCHGHVRSNCSIGQLNVPYDLLIKMKAKAGL